MYFVAFLALCYTALATEPHIDRPAADHASLVASTMTRSGMIYVWTGQPTISPFEELEVEKRDEPTSGIGGDIEATIVIDTVPAALSTVFSPQGSSTTITVPNEATVVPNPDPSGIYGAGSGPGIGSGTGPGSGPGSSSGTVSGSSGEPNLPSGAYGQSPGTVGPGEQSSNPSGQLSPNPTGGQSASPAGQQAPNTTGQQSLNGQSSNPIVINPPVLTTVVPLFGTIVETVTINLESAPDNTPLSTSYSSETSDTGVWEPSPAPETTFVTIQTSVSPSTPCESPNTGSWGLLSASNPVLTTFVTAPGPWSSSPISTTSNTPSIVVVTVSGSQEQLSGSASTENPTSFDDVSWTTTPISPGWETTSGSTVTTPNSLQTGTGATVSEFSSTCTTDIFTNVISTSHTPSTITAAATMAAGSSASFQKTSWSFETFSTANPTIIPVPDVNTGVPTTDLSMSVFCGVVTFALLASIIFY